MFQQQNKLTKINSNHLNDKRYEVRYGCDLDVALVMIVQINQDVAKTILQSLNLESDLAGDIRYKNLLENFDSEKSEIDGPYKLSVDQYYRNSRRGFCTESGSVCFA